MSGAVRCRNQTELSGVWARGSQSGCRPGRADSPRAFGHGNAGQPDPPCRHAGGPPSTLGDHCWSRHHRARKRPGFSRRWHSSGATPIPGRGRYYNTSSCRRLSRSCCCRKTRYFASANACLTSRCTLWASVDYRPVRPTGTKASARPTLTRHDGFAGPPWRLDSIDKLQGRTILL